MAQGTRYWGLDVHAETIVVTAAGHGGLDIAVVFDTPGIWEHGWRRDCWQSFGQRLDVGRVMNQAQ